MALNYGGFKGFTQIWRLISAILSQGADRIAGETRLGNGGDQRESVYIRVVPIQVRIEVLTGIRNTIYPFIEHGAITEGERHGGLDWAIKNVAAGR